MAVGGEDNKLVLRSVECYDPHAHCWRSLSCLPFAVRCVHSIIYNCICCMVICMSGFVQ